MEKSEVYQVGFRERLFTAIVSKITSLGHMIVRDHCRPRNLQDHGDYKGLATGI